MSYDFFAAGETIKKEDGVQDLYAKIQLLANNLVSDSAKKRASEKHRRLFQEKYTRYIQAQLHQFSELLIDVSSLDIEVLPHGSVVLWLKFRLMRPFLSTDDALYYILDNPVRKEKVFGLPMVAPTGWKGALRAAMTRELASGLVKDEQEKESNFVKRRLRLYRLFGNEDASVAAFLNRALARHRIGPLPEDADDEQREEWQKRIEAETERAAQEFDALLREQGYRRGDVEGFQGRLRFYPTFFTQSGLEVINPHSRESGAGKQPIYFECVPIGAQGAFTLLYMPVDLIGEPADKARAELADDLMTIGEGIRAMLTIHGFGAKTSSGFGVVSDKLMEPGQLVLKVADLHSEEPEQSQPAKPQHKRKKKLRRYWKAENQLKDEFLTDDNELIPEKEYQEYIESLGQEYTKSDRQLYAKAKKWWKREGKALAEQPEKKPELETKPETVEAQWPERRFDSLEEMVEKIEVLAEQLRPGGTQ